MSEPRECAACASSRCSRPDAREAVALAELSKIGVAGDDLREEMETLGLRYVVA